MRRRIAILNQKGGVGKTTTTAHLGAALARAGARVLLVDLDPQGHLTLHFGIEVSDGQPSVYDVLTEGARVRDVAVWAGERLAVVPADIDLAGAEAELVSVTGREVLLQEALAAAAEEFDYLLIDCPPSLGVLTVNALAACGEVIIPLQAQFFALQGLSRLLDTVTLVRRRINPDLEVSGVVLCMHETATRLGNEVLDDLKRFIDSARGTAVPWSKAQVFPTGIRRNIKLAEASSFGQTVFDYAPRSNGAVDYAQLAVEVFGEAARMPDESETTPGDQVGERGELAEDKETPDVAPVDQQDCVGPAEGTQRNDALEETAPSATEADEVMPRPVRVPPRADVVSVSSNGS